MLAALMAPILVVSDTGPLDEAIAATQAPETLRAAFTLELRGDNAYRVYDFDPRRPEGSRWLLLKEDGENSELDQVGAAWGAETAPDGRLFPDNLRASMSRELRAEDYGTAWRVSFDHEPSGRGGELDQWAAQHLEAQAWLEPNSARLLRIDHTLPQPVSGPRGVRLLKYEQSHYLETEPTYGLSFISAISVDLEARAGFRRIARRYEARVIKVEFFFASIADEAVFLEARAHQSVNGH